MTEAQEVRARAKALRERREELEKALAGAAGPGARPLRLELARVKEELVDCARRLKELMPSHKVRCRTTWAGVDGWQWDRFQYQTWAELEGAGEQDGPTELDRMRLAVRLARERPGRGREKGRPGGPGGGAPPGDSEPHRGPGPYKDCQGGKGAV